MHDLKNKKNNIMEIKNAEIGFNKKNKKFLLLSNVNITAQKGELIGLTGVNGSGKSTFLRTLAGLLPVLKGEVFIDNKISEEYSNIERAKKIAFVPSGFVDVKYLKVKDVVALGRFPHKKFSSQNTEKDTEVIKNALKTVGMSGFSERYLSEMSDGERQKIMTARALAQETDIILPDEPASFLDFENKFTLYKIFADTTHLFNKTIVFSTHDLNIALKYCDKVWLIKDKTIIEGAPEDLMLSGVFNSIFSNKHIFFNDETFEFSVKFEKNKAVYIENFSNSEFRKNVLKNALNRNNFFVSEDKKAKISIKITKDSWTVSYNKTDEVFYNIYDLIKKIRKLIY